MRLTCAYTGTFLAIKKRKTMNKGLVVKGKEIKFEKWGAGEIWYPCITKSFKIKFEDIKIVAISPRLALDDEMMIVTLIDKEENFYQFSSFEFGKESIKDFEKDLGIKSIRNFEWEKFSWEEHEDSITDKIIYPKELYWEDLFIKPKYVKKIIIQVLKFVSLKKSISGKLNPKTIEYLKK